MQDFRNNPVPEGYLLLEGPSQQPKKYPVLIQSEEELKEIYGQGTKPPSTGPLGDEELI